MNKKVIRRKRESGNFTTIPMSILRDKRLSNGAFRILVDILSDAESYKLTQVNIASRFDVNKTTIKRAFKELEKLGYMRRKELKRGHSYVISEFANLSREQKEVEIVVEQETSQTLDFKKNEEELEQFCNQNLEHLQDNIIEDKTRKLITAHTSKVDGNCYTDMIKLREAFQEAVNERLDEKKKLYKEIVQYAESKYNARNTYKKCLDEFKKLIRIEIFDNHNLSCNYTRIWARCLMANRKVVIDYETELQDRSNGYD